LKKENPQIFKLYAQYMDGKIEADYLKTSNLLTPYNNSWEQKPTPAQKNTEK